MYHNNDYHETQLTLSTHYKVISKGPFSHHLEYWAYGASNDICIDQLAQLMESISHQPPSFSYDIFQVPIVSWVNTVAQVNLNFFNFALMY